MVATPAGMFTWERVAAYQCVRDVQYSVTLGGPEDTYFSGICASALRSIIGDSGDFIGLRVHNIQYSQLKPLAALMPDEIPMHITVFEEVGPNGKARCVAHFPDGTAFEVLKATNLCYSLHVVTTGLQVNGAPAEDHEWTVGLNSTLTDIPKACRRPSAHQGLLCSTMALRHHQGCDSSFHPNLRLGIRRGLELPCLLPPRRMSR